MPLAFGAFTTCCSSECKPYAAPPQVRVTEAAALAAAHWLGKGQKDAADGAAVDAMRKVLGSISFDGVVVIGEGEKDNAPMLFCGERIGDGRCATGVCASLNLIGSLACFASAACPPSISR